MATVGRLFTEIGGDATKFNAAVQSAIKKLADLKLNLGPAGRALIATFDDALNPTKAFGEQLQLLSKAGYSVSQQWAVLGEKAKTFADTAAKNGQAIDSNVQRLLDFGKTAKSASFDIEALGNQIKNSLQNPMEAAKAGVGALIEKMGPAATGLMAIGTAAVFTGKAVFDMLVQMADSMEQLENLSAITGLTTQQLQSFEQYAKEAGLGSLDLGRTIGMLNKQLGEGEEANKDFAEKLAKIGVSMTDLATGRPKDVITLLDDLRVRLQSITDPAERAQAAHQVLGGRLRELIPFVTQSSESFQQLQRTMEEAGITTDQFTKTGLANLDKAMDLAERTAAGLWNTMKNAFAAETMQRYAIPIALLISSLSKYDEAAQQAEDATRAFRLGMEKAEMQWKQWDAEWKKGEKDREKAAENLRKLAQAQEEYRLKVWSTASDEKVMAALLAEQQKRWEDLHAIWKVSIQLREELSKKLQQITRDLEDMNRGVLVDLQKSWEEFDKSLAKLLDKDLVDRVRKAEVEIGIVPAKKIADAWSRQISTIVTDFSRGIADMIFSAKSFADSMTAIFKEMGKSIVRILVEVMFAPLEKYLVRILTGMLTVKAAAGSTGGSEGEDNGFGGLSTGGRIGLGITGGALAIKGMFDKGWKGWLSTIGGGAAIGFAIGGPLGALGGAIYGAIAKGIQALVTGIKGKNAWQAGAPEIARDFGGVGIGSKDFQDWISKNLGLSESQLYPIRKDVLSSPKVLTELIGPLAKAQGRYQEFLKSLENVTTAWGTFNFRKAYELGDASGDWSELNKQFVAAFGNSQALIKAMPDFASKLAAVAMSAAEVAAQFEKEQWAAFKDAIEGSIEPVKTMFDKFLQGGEITEELRRKIVALGGDLAAFERYANLVKISAEFESLVEHWRQTGEILPALRSLIKDFRGDMMLFSKMDEITGLQSSLDFIGSLKSALEGLVDAFDPIKQLLSGNMNADVIAALKKAGLDPNMFSKLLPLIEMERGWDKAVNDFFTGIKYVWDQEAGKWKKMPLGLVKGGILEKALLEYGGTAGKKAVENWYRGINTITQSLLDQVKMAMDADYQRKIKSTLDYLGARQKETSDRIAVLTAEVNKILADVRDKISTAINDSKRSIVEVLNQILVQLGGTPTVNPASPVPTGGRGTGTGTANSGWTVIVEGPIYGIDDLDKKIAASVSRTFTRGGLSLVGAR